MSVKTSQAKEGDSLLPTSVKSTANNRGIRSIYDPQMIGVAMAFGLVGAFAALTVAASQNEQNLSFLNLFWPAAFGLGGGISLGGIAAYIWKRCRHPAPESASEASSSAVVLAP